MSSAAVAFQQDIGAQLARALGSQYRFFKSRLELRASNGDGHNVLVLAGSSKYSPFISLEFYFGRNYALAKRVEQLLGGTPFSYHIQQYSLNRNHMNDLAYSGPYTWSLDITKPSGSLIAEMMLAVHGIADPFFQRFYSIESARNAIAADDPWCFGGPAFWKQLLLLDAAMNELPHFEDWATQLDDFSQSQAQAELEKLAVLGIR
jgi:hypothetical protein